MVSEMEVLDSDELIALAGIDINNEQFAHALIKLKHALLRCKTGEINAIIARLYARIGLFDKAQKHFESYLQEYPDALTEMFQYAMTHYDAENMDESYEVFESILRQDPKHPPALYYSSLVLVNQSRHAEAEMRLQYILDEIDSENLFSLKAKELLGALGKGDFSKTDTEVTIQ